jgi:hypothetical protein
MSNSSGFDVDNLFGRLNLGVRGLQAWREHRRARFDDVAPAATVSRPPTVVAAAASPAASPARDIDNGPHPHGFVDLGGRLLPVYRVPPPGPEVSPTATAVTTPEPPEPPPAAPTTAAPPLASTDAPRSTRLSSVAPLKIPLPTPPACLARATTPAADEAEPASAPEPTAAVPAPEPAHAAARMDFTLLEAVLQHHRDAEATRLEQVHAEHRALLVVLLGVHQAQQTEQAEQQQRLIRNLLAEHRAELQTHTEPIRALLTQQREDVQKLVAAAGQTDAGPTRSITALHDLLANQAKLQAEAHEQTEQHIADLADVLGGLGQTIGQLAQATFERKPSFVPPALASLPWPPPPSPPHTPAVAPTPSTASSSSEAPALPSPREPAAQPRASRADETPPPHPRPAREPHGEASRAQARVREVIDQLDDDDDDDLEDIVDPDERSPRSRLPPFTPLDHSDSSEPAHV